MTSLYRCGLIRAIEFPSTATPKDIESIVVASYASLPAIVEGQISLFHFVLLSKKSISRGARPLLVPHKTSGDFDLQDLEWRVVRDIILESHRLFACRSMHNHRQEKMYKRCIFISLPRWSPNIKLDIDDDSDVEDSDSVEDPESSVRIIWDPLHIRLMHCLLSHIPLSFG